MKIIQHYAQGGKHKANDIPCEDRTYSLSANGVTVIALADGAGGKRYTHAAVGAECVTKTISEFFCNNFDRFYDIKDKEEMKSVFVGVCHHNLKIAAEEIGVDEITKLSSTLLVVAVKGRKAIVCHIGDGVIGKVTANSTRVISAPDNGEFANHTFFISNPAAVEHLHIYRTKTDDVISFFMMSDGTAEYVYDEDAARFHDSARKMSLMAGEANGEEKLAETIETYMIGPDPSSDDCSFITMLFDEKVKNLNVGLPKKDYEGEEKAPAAAPVVQENVFVPEMQAQSQQNAEAPSFAPQDVNIFFNEEQVRTVVSKKKGADNLKIIAAVLALLCAILIVYSCITAAKIRAEKEKLEKEVNGNSISVDEHKDDEEKEEKEEEETNRYENDDVLSEEIVEKEPSQEDADTENSSDENASVPEKTTTKPVSTKPTTTKPTTTKPTTTKPTTTKPTTTKPTTNNTDPSEQEEEDKGDSALPNPFLPR